MNQKKCDRITRGVNDYENKKAPLCDKIRKVMFQCPAVVLDKIHKIKKIHIPTVEIQDKFRDVLMHSLLNGRQVKIGKPG